MTMKINPASSTSLGPNASDLTQQLDITNTAEGEKPLAFKLKINYTPEGQAPVSQIKVIKSTPTDY